MSFIIKLINVFDSYNERNIFLKLNELLGKDLKQVIDVGAHQGEFIIKLSKLFRLKSALSFEPNPEVFKILNNKTNDLQNKKIFIKETYSFYIHTFNSDKAVDSNIYFFLFL